ncbi:hypothetical protein IFR05_012096 [Cadophora sp. M221]|nr:hypothetical protein IFR05_012096 [Cadophora sp. M221]
MDIEELKLYDLEDENGELTDEEAKRARFRLLGPIGQAHNIVVHIGGSAARTDVFRNVAGRLIPMNNRTRWNSWYNMLLVLLLLKGKVEEYCDKYEDELEEDLLSREDWKKVEMIKDFLAPFSRATLATEGDSVSIDRTLFNTDILIKHLQETTDEIKKKKDEESNDFLIRLNAAHKVLDNYYQKPDISPFYAAALVLNPMFRTRFINLHWPRKWGAPALAKVKKLRERTIGLRVSCS